MPTKTATKKKTSTKEEKEVKSQNVKVKTETKAVKAQPKTKAKTETKETKKATKTTAKATKEVKDTKTLKKETKTAKKEVKAEKPAITEKKTNGKTEQPEVEEMMSGLSEEEIGEDLDEKKNHPPTENNPNETLAREVIRETLKQRINRGDLKPVTSEPTSMEELLTMTGYQLQGLKKSQEVLATITDKGRRSLFFDIGAKTEGILIEKEMEQVEDYIKFLEVGDTVVATVVSPENEKGQILLSLAKAATDWKWKLFQKYLETGEEVEVRGLDINRGGMIARLMNIRGFIPVSQFGRQWVGKLDQLYNKVFPVKIIEVDREKNRLIFSEKAVSESDMIQKQQEMLTEVKVGSVYKGQVSGVMAFGIFVRVMLDPTKKDGAFLDGLVHISEISWEKVNDVHKLYKVGDIVDVQVMDIDQGTGKLNLSIKRLMADPWQEIAKSYPVDTKTKGTITRLAAFGAFVEIEKGIEGLIHISKIPSDANIKVGDPVDVYIESLDPVNHRISLGMVLSAKPVGYK